MAKLSARRVVLTITNLFSELVYVHAYRKQCFSCRHGKLRDKVWTATVLNWNKSFTHRRSCRSGWRRRFIELNPGSPHAEYLPVSIRSSPLLYFFTSATVRIAVRAKCALGAASLCHRNRAEVPVLLCEQRPYPVRFFVPAQKPCGRAWTINLNNGNPIYLWFDNEAFRNIQII